MELLANFMGTLLVWFVELVPDFLYERVVSKAAEKNSREFQNAHPNSMAAWKHLPW